MGKVSPLRRTAGVLLALAFFGGCDDGEGSWPRLIDADMELTDVYTCSLAWGDYDNDGDLDLVLAGYWWDGDDRYETTVYRNDGGEAFTDIGANLPGIAACSVAWSDYDSDGDLDLALQGYAGVTAVSMVYRNDDGTFTDTGAGLAGVALGALAWGDYDNDGDLDLAQTGSGPVAKVYRNDGGTFVDTGAALTGVICSSVAWGDYDNDGDLDLALAGYTGADYVSKVYSNDGGTFTDTGAGLIGVEWCSLAWGDYDNDGDLDLALAGYSDAAGRVTRIYRNDDGTVFTDIGASVPFVMRCSLAWGDYDNDGDFDLLVSGSVGEVIVDLPGGDHRHAFPTVAKVCRNDGDDVFAEVDESLKGVSVGSVAWGDYDDDGDLDLALSGMNDEITTWGCLSRIYRNGCCAPNTWPTAPTGLATALGSGEVTFSWSTATDVETPQTGLTYNLRVGTGTNKDDVMPGMSIIGGADDGKRLIPAMGNVQHNTSWTLKGLAAGDYYWSVQAIDTAFEGSPWAPEQTVIVP